MPAGRFIVAGLALHVGSEVDLPPEVAHQARDVLRLGSGDTLRLLDGAGGVYAATITTLDRRRVVARIGAALAVDPAAQIEPKIPVTLCQGMLKAAKYELVLQKCTELGVAAFMPLLTERAVAAVEEASESKRQRWARIVAEAVEQCGGTRLPTLHPPRPLLHALADLPAHAVALLPWEGAGATPLRSALADRLAASDPQHPLAEVRLFIGPEGGFSAGEMALAERAGAITVTLGPRILRAETAAIVAATLTLDALGALNGAPIT